MPPPIRAAPIASPTRAARIRQPAGCSPSTSSLVSRLKISTGRLCLKGLWRKRLWQKTARDDVDDRVDGPPHVRFAGGQLVEHPARQDLLERPVEDERGEPRVGVRPHLAARAGALDHP